MKETYTYGLVRKFCKSIGGWICRIPDPYIGDRQAGKAYAGERPDFIWILGSDALVVEVKVQRTKRDWNPFKDGRESQRLFLETIRREGGAPTMYWCYSDRVRHRKPYGPDLVWFFVVNRGWVRLHDIESRDPEFWVRQILEPVIKPPKTALRDP